VTDILFNGNPIRETDVVNLTPHPVIITTPFGDVHLEPLNEPARLVSTRLNARTLILDGIPVDVTRYILAEPSGLPAVDAGRFLVVSRAVAERYPHRPDLVFPTGMERDPRTGSVVACRGLGTFAEW